jgi:hypothetical protein
MGWNMHYGSEVLWRSHENENASGEVALCGAALVRERDDGPRTNDRFNRRGYRQPTAEGKPDEGSAEF